MEDNIFNSVEKFIEQNSESGYVPSSRVDFMLTQLTDNLDSAIDNDTLDEYEVSELSVRGDLTVHVCSLLRDGSWEHFLFYSDKDE